MTRQILVIKQGGASGGDHTYVIPIDKIVAIDFNDVSFTVYLEGGAELVFLYNFIKDISIEVEVGSHNPIYDKIEEMVKRYKEKHKSK